MEPSPSTERPTLPSGWGPVLVGLARSAIRRRLGLAVDGAEVGGHWLDARGATFVTLEIRGRLRGCIGSLRPTRSLRHDVRENAVAAAFRDPRFPPLEVEELAALAVKVSVLSPFEPLAATSEEELLLELRPGHDGLVLRCGLHRATFLPQVWEQLPEPRQFLERLREKAGLPPGFWRDDLAFERYTVESWGQETP